MSISVMALTVLIASAAQTSSAQAPTPPPACAGPEHRQFDFWVGEWDVSQTGKTDIVASSRIERLHGGCVIRERWMPRTAEGGSSLNHYDKSQRRWRQIWIDSVNSRVEFEGGLVGDTMVLTGFWKNANGLDKDGLVRMSYSRAKDGAVRQFGEISTDHGVNWSPFFDLTYRPAKSSK